MFYVLKIHININTSNFHLRIIGANSWHNRECLEALRNSTMGHFRGVLWKGLAMALLLLQYVYTCAYIHASSYATYSSKTVSFFLLQHSISVLLHTT